MRATRFPVALLVCACALAFGASSASAALTIDVDNSSATNTTIDVTGYINSDGDDFSYHFDYFPKVLTENCNFPDAGDMFAIQSSETQFHAGVSSSTLVSAT
ncbi:MAG: hypothetical protein QM648_05835, partial [Solirubrobacterales bacterium]